jgi:hypothetical protein
VNEVKRTLENRFSAFLAQLEGAECVDETLSEPELAYGKRADFLLDHRRVILEVKLLRVDPQPKVEERLKPHRNRPEFPAFYWDADLNEILPHLPDGEEIRREIFHAVTRSVQSALENADDQIAATKAALGLAEACGVVAILNEKVGILAPEFVTAKASQMLRKTKNGGIRYRNIAYVWIIAESHRLAGKDGSEHLPLILLEGPTAAEHPVAGEYLNSLQPLWAAWQEVPFFDLGLREHFDGLKFEKRAESVSYPERPLVRHEIWRRAYRQTPYLRPLSGDAFLDHAARIIRTMALHFLKGGRKLANAAVAELMEGWTHVLEEAEHRRLDMRKLQARLPDLDVLRRGGTI